MEERIILDDESRPPGGSPLGLLVAVGIVAVSIAVVALRPSEVSPNSLGASPPTTLFVPPEALTTTLPERSLTDQVPGLRGAIHFDVVTDDGRQLWVWNASQPLPTVVDAPGPLDISSNRRYALSVTENQAGDGVVWLGPKLDLRPADIVPGLTGAVWHRAESEWLVVGRTQGASTVLTWWSFSGARHDVDRSLEVPGAWAPVYLTEGEVGLVSAQPTQRFGERSIVIDAQTGDIVLEFGGRMWATTGPPVVYDCHNLACTSSTIGWIEERTLQPSPRQSSIFPSSGSELVAAVARQGTIGQTEIVTGEGTTLMTVPYSGEIGAWSGDGRFFVFSKTEFGFGDDPGLVFVDTLEQTYHEVAVPSAADWFVTRIWYGP